MSESDSDTESDHEGDDEMSKKEQELRAECVADVITPNSFIALFSPLESFVLF